MLGIRFGNEFSKNPTSRLYSTHKPIEFRVSFLEKELKIPNKKEAVIKGFLEIPFMSKFMVLPGNKKDVFGKVLFLGRKVIMPRGKRLSFSEDIVRRYPRKFLSPIKGESDGHFYVGLRDDYGKQYNWQIGRVVLVALLGRNLKRGMQCCHNNGNPNDNRPENLREGTPSSNQKDRKKHGTDNGSLGFVGEKHPSAKLTWKQVNKIRSLFAKGSLTQRELANKYGICRPAISNIINGKNWK